jgi:hypothetical protein
VAVVVEVLVQVVVELVAAGIQRRDRGVLLVDRSGLVDTRLGGSDWSENPFGKSTDSAPP